MCSQHLDQHGVSLRLNLSTYDGALADPEYVCMVVPQFEPKKKVANLCVRLRASEQINACVVTNGCLAHFLGIFVSGKDGIRLMRRIPYYLDQMDH